MSTQTDQANNTRTNRVDSDEETDYVPRQAFMEPLSQPEPKRRHVSIIVYHM